MKNLELFQLLRNRFKDKYIDITHIAFQDEYTFYLKNNLLHIQDQHELKVFDNTYNCITQFEILKIERILWFGTGKEFIWVDLSKQLHVIPLEFSAAVWNPSQDALVVIQPDGEIGVFIVNFNDETIIPMGSSHLIDAVSNTVINVGWGSEKTQFRGTAGKLLNNENTDIPVTHNDDLKPRVSWRGNGDMFVVNYWNDEKRKFKVFKFPCELLYESSDIIGLQPIIAWKPEGNLIASVTHITEKCEISLFEKNCLIKNSIRLEEKPMQVLDVKWSPCGQILAVHQCLENEVFIELYTTKNYVWYLKQRLDFAESNPMIKFEFNESPSSIVTLLVTTARETIAYFFKFVVHISPLYDTKTAITCGVLNGKNIWLTDCERGMAPPPMFDRTIITNKSVNFMQFHPTLPKLVVVDCCSRVFIYDLDTCKLIASIDDVLDNTLDIPMPFHHFIWSSTSQLMCLRESEEGTYKMIIDTNDKKLSYWDNDKDRAQLTGVTYLGAIYPVYFQQAHKEITVYDFGNSILTVHTLPSFALCLHYIKINETHLVLSLTPSQEFFVNDTKMLTGVLSFIVHQNYLLLTTTENTLICIRLKNLLSKDNLFKNAYCRFIEQGSYLLFGLPNRSSIVLQMPRGNIEMCAVRIMSIDRLETLLEQQNWKQAIDLVRLERMNTTVLVDLNFNRFIKNIDKFVQSIETPAVINDFLLGLQEENVLNTLYKECAFGKIQDVKEKVEKVCNSLIDYLEKYNYHHYLNSIIIACFVKNSKDSNYEALGHIQNLLRAMKSDRSIINIAESVFSGINTLKPNSDMYNYALLMYDLDLALFVARNLQMDPKEYEPFINALKEYDEIKRRFVINDHLKRFSVAVKYLIRCSYDSDEIIDYVKKYGVYDVAYNYTKHGSELHKEMAIIYAESLRKQKMFEEAATILCSVELFKEAYEDYKESLAITSAVLTLSRLNLPTNEYKVKIRELAEACIAARRILEAGTIYETYLMDYDIAMDLYVRNHYFSEAQKCATKFNCYNDYKLHMFEVILSYSDELTTKLKTMRDTFHKYRDRLATVKTGKIEKLSAVHDINQLTLIDDSMSVADTLSTVVTSSSRVSTVSRRRRKEERKKQDLREGGVYEDIALMRALYELISEVFSFGPVVRELCLITFNIDASGNSFMNSLHNLLLNFQIEINKAITEIWPLHLNNPAEDNLESSIYDNVKVLDVKYREPPSNLDTSWKLHIMSNV
ncbi:hypothetical protein RN001_007672 [Aquatica leii]|uniref:Elongator complex protein 1 n=1 Tax=Aquatica leii TaxID=1421715 RepID=A0AAN7S979_9COLE|nr:hypothetical protein RN001_007672 [Aquatica leii]